MIATFLYPHVAAGNGLSRQQKAADEALKLYFACADKHESLKLPED